MSDAQLKLIDGNALKMSDNMNGGGVFNQGVLQIFASVVKGHKADEGGAIYNAETGTIEAVSTAFSDNDVSEGGTGQGGGIHNDGGGLFVESCSYENNKAAKGGGSSIYSEGSLTIIATTFDDADSVVGDDGELRDAAFGGSVVFVGGTINSMFGGTVYVNVSSCKELQAVIADKAVITVTYGFSLYSTIVIPQNTNVTIRGATGDEVLDGQGQHQHLYVEGALTLERITLMGGYTSEVRRGRRPSLSPRATGSPRV